MSDEYGLAKLVLAEKYEFMGSDVRMAVRRAVKEIEHLTTRNDELETEAIKDWVRINCSREEINRITAANERLEKSWLQLMTIEIEDGNYVASISVLPGCVGVGGSEDEAMRTCLGFVPGWVDLAKERGNRLTIGEKQ